MANPPNARPLTVAVIPSRYGSTRLPAKPLVDLCGKPMVQRVYEQVRKASSIDRVVIATDHQAIADAVTAFGGEVMLTPVEMRSGTDRVAWVAARMPEAEIIVNVQGDEPLIQPAMIDQAVQPLIDHPEIEAGTLAKIIKQPEDLQNPAVVKVALGHNGNALYFSRSPIPFVRDENNIAAWPERHQYYKHIGLYVYRRPLLVQFAAWPETALERAEKLEQLRILEHGRCIHVALTEFETVPIDTPADVRRVIDILQHAETDTV